MGELRKVISEGENGRGFVRQGRWERMQARLYSSEGEALSRQRG